MKSRDAQPHKTSEKSSQAALETRERLIITAERLFAEEGIDSVSLRSINQEAQQKNVSALHYHFGSREALIQAIFDFRMSGAARRRHELMNDIMASGQASDIRKLVGAAVWPLAEQILSDAGPNRFVRFLAQYYRLPHVDSWTFIRHRNRNSLLRVYVALIRIVGQLPRRVVHARLVMALRQGIYFLADIDRVIEQGNNAFRDEMVLFHANELIDLLTVEIQAPMSPETLGAFSALQSCGKSPMFSGPGAMPFIR